MGNAQKHVSHSTRRYMLINDINHFITPAQSPDLNASEMVWNDLKYYLSTKQISTRDDLGKTYSTFLDI